jgi:serine protease AprX
VAKVSVLLEVEARTEDALTTFEVATASEQDAVAQAEALLEPAAGLGVELEDEVSPVPMFVGPAASPYWSRAPERRVLTRLSAFSSSATNADFAAGTAVVAASVERRALEELESRSGVWVWPNSPIQLLGGWESLGISAFDEAPGDLEGGSATEPSIDTLFDLARSRAGIDCRPYRPAVTVSTIRSLLGVRRLFFEGFLGQNIVVGILDEGVNGSVYPVVGGLRRPGAPAPGTAPITSHGSMCAADVLIAAPATRLYDYPFLGQPRSGGALAMFNAVLDQRRLDGTPHLTSNSYGFTGVPRRDESPRHEVHDINHPLHRKVREVVASGAPCFYAAGNCGEQCPSGNCHVSGIGPGRSIHASNSLREVITIAAVNSRHERIGYSSQGPGMFDREKPDLACYSHIFANFGPGRPGGTAVEQFDNGTSAATPVACGVGALLLSAFPGATPAQLKDALRAGATRIETARWDPGYGKGIVNAAGAYHALRQARARTTLTA